METLNILFIGDIHIKLQNLESVEKMQNKIFSIQNLFCIVIAGDVLNTHEIIHTQLLNKAYSFIETCLNIAPTYILVGNHDYINNQQFLTDSHWMNGIKKWQNVTIVDKPVIITSKIGDFLCVPYVPPGRLVEALNTLLFNWEKDVKVIFAHQEIYGCKMGAISSTLGDVWKEEWPILISGHIHDRQKIGKNVIYPGSSINHSYGSNNQGIFIFTFSQNNMEETFVDLNFENKRVFYLSLNDVNVLEQKLKKQKSTQKLTTVNISGNANDIKVFKKSKQFNDLIQLACVRFKCTDNKLLKTEKDSPFWEILTRSIADCKDPELEKDFTSVKTQCQHI